MAKQTSSTINIELSCQFCSKMLLIIIVFLFKRLLNIDKGREVYIEATMLVPLLSKPIQQDVSQM